MLMKTLKTMKTKIIKIFIFCILLASFCGCSGNRYTVAGLNETAVKAEPVKAADSGSVQSAGDTFLNEEELPCDTLILTVNSDPVYWPEFKFWLKYIEKYYQNNHPDELANWDAKKMGMGLNEFFFSTATGYACKDRAIEAKAKELGIELSVRDLAEIEKKRKSNIEIYGSELEYLRIVSSMYVTEDVFNYLTQIDYLGEYLFKDLYGASGEKCTDEDVSGFIKDRELRCAKFVFLSNKDDEGNLLSTEKQAENYRLMADMISQLTGSSEPMSLFNQWMNKYNSEITAANYPDGCLFISGSRGDAFEDAYSKLKDYECSGVIKSDDGLYLILRMPITPDMPVDSSGTTLRYTTAYGYLYKKTVEDMAAKMDVKYEEVYYKLLKQPPTLN
jgi:hypothetical protein